MPKGLLAGYTIVQGVVFSTHRSSLCSTLAPNVLLKPHFLSASLLLRRRYNTLILSTRYVIERALEVSSWVLER
jgi:hypothetical protein